LGLTVWRGSSSDQRHADCRIEIGHRGAAGHRFDTELFGHRVIGDEVRGGGEPTPDAINKMQPETIQLLAKDIGVLALALTAGAAALLAVLGPAGWIVAGIVARKNQPTLAGLQWTRQTDVVQNATAHMRDSIDPRAAGSCDPADDSG